MRVEVKIIGISPPIPGFEGKRDVSVEFTGNSLMGLLLHITSEMDAEIRELFLDERGGIAADLAVIINGSAATDSNRGNLRLEEADRIELVSSAG